MDWKGVWSDVGTVLSPLNVQNIHQVRTFTVPSAYNPNFGYRYRIVAQNAVGYGSGFPAMTVQSMSAELPIGTLPLAPSGLTATLQNGPRVKLTWTDTAINESGFVIERSTDGINFTQVATAPALGGTGLVSYTDNSVPSLLFDVTYTYRVAAVSPVGSSAYSNTAFVLVLKATPPAAPSALGGTLVAGPQVQLTLKDNASNENGFVIERSTNGINFTQIGTAPALSGTGSVTVLDPSIKPALLDVTYSYRVAAVNTIGASAYSNIASVLVPALPAAPGNLTVVNGPNSNKTRSVILNWIDNSGNETGFTIQRATNSTFTLGLTSVTVGANVQTLTVTGLSRSTQYWFRIRSNNGTIISSVWVNASPFPILTNP